MNVPEDPRRVVRVTVISTLVPVEEESLVYGCIVGPPGSSADWYGLYPRNKSMIDALPIADSYPPLTRGIFTVPMDYGQPGTAFYRQQVIHFGASFSHLSEFWHLWIAKFEELLRGLHWSEARVHLENELYGSFEYRWEAVWTGDEIPWHRVPPQPTSHWSFQGGPRDFRAATGSAQGIQV